MKFSIPKEFAEQYRDTSYFEVLSNSPYFIPLDLSESGEDLVSELVETDYMFFDKVRLENLSELDRKNLAEGIVSIAYLISKGKLYDASMIPANFVISTVGYRVKAILRHSPKEHRTNITWKTLIQVKTLVGLAFCSEEISKEVLSNTDTVLTEVGKEIVSDNLFKLYEQVVNEKDIEGVLRVLCGGEIPKALEFYSKIHKDIRNPLIDYSLPKEEQEEVLGKGKKSKRPTPKKQVEKSVRNTNTVSEGVGGSLNKLLLGLLVVSLGVSGFLFYNGNKTKQGYEDKIAKINQSIRNNNSYYDGLLKASILDYAGAVNSFEEFRKLGNVKNAKDVEIEAMLYAYILDNKYQEALDIRADEQTAQMVVVSLKKNNKLGDVKNLKSDTKIIKFEQAALVDDWNTLASLSDKIPLKGNEDREIKVCRAFVEKGELDKALEVAKQVPVKGLLNSIKKWSFDKVDASIKNPKDNQNEKNAIGKKVDQVLKDVPNG